jgi:hypothetical protein
MTRVIFYIAICAMTSCAAGIDTNTVAGTYLLKQDHSDVLQLDSGGMYQHTYRSDDGRDVMDTGTWELEIVEGVSTVTLHNFRSTTTGVKAFGTGYYLLKATSSLGGKIRLWIDEDKNIYYYQVKK